MAKIRVSALWFQRNVGLQGYIGAIREDGTPFALCSKEKWDFGPNDSLRKGWDGDVRIGDKTLGTDYTLAELEDLIERGKAMNEGSPLELTVPPRLRRFLSVSISPAH